MTLDISQLVLFGVFCSSLHWLIGRSEIAKPLWSRATGWFAALLACAGCSGFWIGGILGGAGFVLPVTFNIAPGLYFEIFLRALWHGVLGVFVTPVFEGILLWGLHASALAPEQEDVEPEPAPSNRDAMDTPVDSPIRRVPRLP